MSKVYIRTEEIGVKKRVIMVKGQFPLNETGGRRCGGFQGRCSHGEKSKTYSVLPKDIFSRLLLR